MRGLEEFAPGLRAWIRALYWVPVLAAGVWALRGSLPGGVELYRAFEDPSTSEAAALARARLFEVLRVGLAGALVGLAASGKDVAGGRLLRANPPSFAVLLMSIALLVGVEVGFEGRLDDRHSPGAFLVCTLLGWAAGDMSRTRRSAGIFWVALAALILLCAVLASPGFERDRVVDLVLGRVHLGADPGALALVVVVSGFALGAQLAKGRAETPWAGDLWIIGSVFTLGPLPFLGRGAAALAGGGRSATAALAAGALLSAKALAAAWAGPDAVPPLALSLSLGLGALGAVSLIGWSATPAGAERGVSRGHAPR